MTWAHIFFSLLFFYFGPFLASLRVYFWTCTQKSFLSGLGDCMECQWSNPGCHNARQTSYHSAIALVTYLVLSLPWEQECQKMLKGLWKRFGLRAESYKLADLCKHYVVHCTFQHFFCFRKKDLGLLSTELMGK